MPVATRRSIADTPAPIRQRGSSLVPDGRTERPEPDRSRSNVGSTPDREPLRPVESRCAEGHYPILKRCLDLPLGTLLIVLALPTMGLIWAILKVVSPGPALFRQRRLGRHGVPFACLKFRSMRQDAERVLRSDPDLYERYRRNGYKLPAEEDPRIFPFGRFLRKTSLDELPQLFNVIWGDMSLVGPRPIVPDELEEYGEASESFLSAYPGITGWWQVSGRSQMGYPQRASLELEYVQRWHPVLDLRILASTIPAVLGRRGAH